MRILSFLFLFLAICYLPGQVLLGDSTRSQLKFARPDGKNDSLNLKIFQPTGKDYLFWRADHPKKPFDTALSLRNQYRYTQFNNRDNFGKQAFNNVGQPFNTLFFKLAGDNHLQLLPEGKEQVYLYKDSVRYFDVKTPTTEFIFHNGMKEGQVLGTLFTHNINSQFNYALQYKGVRSLGHYLESEVDSRNFIISTNYHSKNHKYALQGHYSVLNNGTVENAGIQTRENFTSGDGNFINRQRLLTNLTNARSKYLNRRYFIGQSFDFLSQQNDSTQTKNMKLQNDFNYESSSFRYFEDQSNTYYLDITEYVPDVVLETNKFNKILSNTTTLVFDIKEKFAIEAGVKYQNVKYFFDNEAIQTLYFLPRSLSDNRIGFVGNMEAQYSDKVYLQAKAEFMSGNTFQSTFAFDAGTVFKWSPNWNLYGNLILKSSTPKLNLIYNQSFYDAFNYYLNDFENEISTQFLGGVNFSKYHTSIEASATRLENYTYLSHTGSGIQSSDPLQIGQLKIKNQFHYKKFHADTQLFFQTIDSEEDVLPLPSFIGRINLYYKSMMFRDAANVQLGIKAQYFTKFASREYFPVMNEFKLQDPTQSIEIGNYPMIDIYWNMRVKTMQIYLEAQHINSFFTGYDYFATPNIPTYDFRLNIGLVWNLFT